MGIFDNVVEAEATELVEESSVEQQSGFIKETGAFKLTITKFFYTQNDNGTTFFNWEGETEEGRKLSQKEWFVTKDGRTQFDETDFKTKEKTGKKKDFSGFSRLKVAVRALTGDENNWKNVENKFVPIYDYDKKEDVDTEVSVLVAAIGKQVEVINWRLLEDATELDSTTGNYEPNGKVKETNYVTNWLDPDTHKTYAESVTGKDSKAYDKFIEASEVNPFMDKRKESKNTDMNATEKPKSEGSEEAKNAFS